MRFKLAKRVVTIGWSTTNALLGAVFSVLLSVEVIRLCSKDLWGTMVELMLWFGLASHVLSFGNDNLLLREFSLMPKNISANWGKSLQSRTWLYILISIILFFSPLEIKLKTLLVIYLAANFFYKSYDVLILFKKQFIISVLLETSGFLLIASYILINNKNISLYKLVFVYGLAELCKAIAVGFLFRKEIKIPVLNFSIAYFSLALPFFLLEFTGLLQSKTDLICVTSLLSKEKIAQYQVYVNFLLIIQSSAGFILAPFIRNIYRMKSKSIHKLAVKFFSFGVVIAFVSIICVNFFIHRFYGFSIPAFTLIAGALFIIPIFFYAIVIYQLLKINKQRSVVIVNILGVVVSLLLNLLLIPYSKDGVSGAIVAIAITQWILLFVYAAIQRRINRRPVVVSDEIKKVRPN
jgi:O-antigen/teichoic acid export membrane protein